MDGYEVGSVLKGSWGYDQTNIDFYRVEKRTKTMLTLQKLQTVHVSDAGFMSDHVEPGEAVEGRVMRRKLHFRDGEPIGCAFQPSYGWISTWNGAPALRTSYA
jgi:hypothetical protein